MICNINWYISCVQIASFSDGKKLILIAMNVLIFMWSSDWDIAAEPIEHMMDVIVYSIFWTNDWNMPFVHIVF